MKITRSAYISGFLLFLLNGCATNPANVRTLASSLQTITSDTPNIIAADNASCAQNEALQAEFMGLKSATLSKLQLAPPPCVELAATLAKISAENKAIQAYAEALSSISQDQFATTTTDANAVTSTLGSLGVSDPVVKAVGSIFTLIETAALDGYRQKELAKVLTGDAATNFKIILESYTALVSQYSEQLASLGSNADLIVNAIAHDHSASEPVAVAEIKIRYKSIHDDISAKQAALADFSKAVSGISPAFDAAAQDVTNPNPKEIYQSVKTFVKLVQDAHDKSNLAFGTH